ncbi:MAG: TldD/PmbA family protein [Candidatus Hodarchaeota archaeon]
MTDDYLISLEYDDVVEHALNLEANFCDIRASEWEGFGLQLLQSKTRNMVSSMGSGAGIRVLIDGAWGFSSTSLVTMDELKTCCEKAIKLAKSSRNLVKEEDKFTISEDIKFDSSKYIINTKEELDYISKEEKIQKILALDKAARETSPLVMNTAINYSDGVGHTLLVNSRGARIEKSMGSIYSLFNVMVMENGNLQSGTEIFSHVGTWKDISLGEFDNAIIEATEQGLRLLKAKPCPPGAFTIIVDNKLGGVFVHEAMGHACEADAILTGQSILEGKIGSKVGNEEVTIYDDGSIEDKFGFIPVDSEGIKTGRTTLIEKGIVKSYINDLETASRMGILPTGNGRAEKYDTLPQVRMTNTFLSKGMWDKEEMISETREGIYCLGWQYGYVQTDKGNFMFKSKEAILIENGELTTPLKDVALSGQIMQVLLDIDAIGDDFGDTGGHCGKCGQFVRVSDGSPHFRIKNIVVGGME